MITFIFDKMICNNEDAIEPLIITRINKEKKPCSTIFLKGDSMATMTKKRHPSRDLKTLVDQFPQACQNPDKLRGWKRARTLYCNWKAKENGLPPKMFAVV